MPITTTTVLPAPVQQSFSYKLLSVPVPNMIHKVPAVKKSLPRNGGRTLRMRRYNPLPVSVVPLGNTGVTPPATPLTAVDIDATISFYGQYIILNEQVSLQNQDPKKYGVYKPFMIEKLLHQDKSLIIYMVRKSFASDVFAGNTISFHNITMWLFNNKIRFYGLKNIIKHFTSSLPVIYWTIKFLFARPSVSTFFGSTKNLFKPKNENLITGSYFEKYMPLPTGSIFTLLDSSDIKASFSIDDSRKICDLFSGLICMKINFLSHMCSFIYNISVINEKIHRERLSEEDLKGYAIV